MRAAVLAAVACAALLAPPSRAEFDEDVPIQRYLVNLRLGDIMKEIKQIYPPVRDWPSYLEPGGSITRVHIERPYAKYFPRDADILRLGMRRKQLVHIQVVFDEKYTHDKHLEDLVVDLSLIYGNPRRTGMVYAWQDGRTVLRAFNSEVPSRDGRAIEMRTTLEIFDKGVFERVD